jgi:hypothetical protein
MNVTRPGGANAVLVEWPREGRWGNIPALPAVIPRCVGRRRRGAPDVPSESQTQRLAGSPC